MRLIYVLFLISLSFSLCGQLRTTILSGADPGGSWVLDDGPLGNTVSGLLIGDNPVIVWNLQPKGEYFFTYTVCSTTPNCINCCPPTQTQFYNLDYSSVSVSNKVVCCHDGVVNYASILDAYTLGNNTIDSIEIVGLFTNAPFTDFGIDSISCSDVGVYNVILTVTPILPSGFSFDISATPDIYNFTLTIDNVCCTIPIVSNCVDQQVTVDSNYILDPPIAGSYDWTTPTGPILASSQISLNPLMPANLGLYCVVIPGALNECPTQYCIQLFDISLLSSDVVVVDDGIGSSSWYYITLFTILGLFFLALTIYGSKN